MAVQDKFEVPIAYNPAGNAGAGELVTGAVFDVFDVGDTSFSTPLTVFNPATGTTITPLRSSGVGVLPDFQVEGARREVLVRSGSFVTRLTSKYGIVFEAGLDPASVSAAIAAGTEAETARAAAVVAQTAAEAKAAEVAGITATTDGIMAAVYANPAAAFTVAVTAAIDDAVGEGGGGPAPVVTDVLWSGTAWPTVLPSGILRANSGWDPTATMPPWFTPGHSVGHMWVAHPASLASL